MPNLTQRSLFRIGDGSLAITLPKSWCTYYGLKAGDKLEVVSNGKVVVRPLKNRLPQDAQLVREEHGDNS